MIFNFKNLDFRFFDGSEGASAGFGESSGVDLNGFSPEARSLLFGDDEQSDAESNQYQSGEEEDDAGQGQVGSDTYASEDIDAEFAELIADNGRYHDIFQQKVTGIIQDRFRNNQRNQQAQIDSISEKLSPLFLNYGLKFGDFDGLGNAIANDENFYRAGAERAGLSVEQYQEQLKLKAEAEAGRRITEAYQQERMRQEMYSKWEQDATALKEVFPNFDLRQEILTNDKFAELLDRGVDVQSAFIATHKDAILSGQRQEVSRQTVKNVVGNIKQRASRPVENGLRHQPAYQRKLDPSELTDKDMDEILDRVREGEVFSF